MFSKIKVWLYAAGAIVLAILYALLRIEKAKRKEEELKRKVAQSNEKAQEKAKHALDYAVTERDRRNEEINEELEKRKKVIDEHDNEIIDDSLRDDIVRMLGKNRNKKDPDKDA